MRPSRALALFVALACAACNGRKEEAPADPKEAAKAREAWQGAYVVQQAVLGYFADRGRYPFTLADLTRTDDDGGPYLGKQHLLDPWGNPYKYDPFGPENGRARPDVWATTPRGDKIGNWKAR